MKSFFKSYKVSPLRIVMALLAHGLHNLFKPGHIRIRPQL